MWCGDDPLDADRVHRLNELAGLLKRATSVINCRDEVTVYVCHPLEPARRDDVYFLMLREPPHVSICLL